MTSLSPADRTRLAKLLGLLASNHAGERDAAAIAANRLVQSRNLTWSDVVELRGAAKKLPELGTWRTTCRLLLERPGSLRAWELTFVRDLPGFNRLSTKQRYVLKEIADRVLGQRPV